MKINLFAVLLAVLLLTAPAGAQQQQKKQAPTPDPAPPAAAQKPAQRKIARKKVVEEDKSTVPPLMDRLEDQRLAVRKGEQREPTSAYLIDEITVTGTYKSVEGYGAFLRAANGRTFFAYSGMKFYDGSIAQIDPDQVVFQQILPDGKKKQIVKAYDPNALRSSAISSQTDKDKDKEKDKGKKEKKKAPKKEETEESDASDDDE